MNKFGRRFDNIKADYDKICTNKFTKALTEAITFLISAVIIFVVTISLVFKFIPPGSLILIVSGRSMEPCLSSGQIVFAKDSNFKRGEIVTADYPEKLAKLLPNRKEDVLVKRIIGVPGDRIVINQKGIYINDKLYEEPYLSEEQKNNSYYDGIKYDSVKLDEDQYYILGDNRGDSADSRFFGAINKSNMYYTYSEKLVKNSYVKLSIFILIVLLDMFLFGLIEFIVIEIAYVILSKVKKQKNPATVQTTGETVFLERRNK